MKYKIIVISYLIFFLIINLSYFWQGKLGFFAFPVTLLLVVAYLVLSVIFLKHLILLFKEKFTNKSHNWVTMGLFGMLLLTYFFPSGFFDFDQFAGKDLLIAAREGGGNCSTTLKLKENGKFVEMSVCFGIDEVKGSFKVKNDTIYFYDVGKGRTKDSYYEYALVKQSLILKNDSVMAIILYKNKKDTSGQELWISKNVLFN